MGANDATHLSLVLTRTVLSPSVFVCRCGPCKRLKPQLVQLSEEHVDTVFVLVDVDACKDVSRANSITCMPTVKAFRDGACVETLQGATAASIAQAIKKHA